ncbi:MAG: hypothetical protein ACYTF3_01455 [Planctomycetota bacterium]|jgi:hypothetical protein
MQARLGWFGVVALGLFATIGCDDAETDGDGVEAGRTIADAAPSDAQPEASLRFDGWMGAEDATVDAGAASDLDAEPPEPDAGPACSGDGECDDGIFCNGVEVCSNGRCFAAAVTPCDDGVSCTADSCDEDAQACVSEPDDALCPESHRCDRKAGCFRVRLCDTPEECDDGFVCNGLEDCQDGICVPGPAIDCNDDVQCTEDVCVEETGECEQLPVHGRCVGAQLCDVEAGCGDRPPCVRDDDCDDASFCNGVETCDVETGECVAGEPPAVDDGVECTIDTCSDALAMVIHTPSPARCSDGLFCNGAEICHPVDGCQAGTPPAVEDGIPCTTDRCDEDADFVEHVPNDAACDDGLFCNGSELCSEVEGCIAGEPPVVNDGVGCTADRCSEVERRVIHVPDDGACDDGLFCNGAEVCDPVDDCQPGALDALDDGVGCTVDECDEELDRVTHRADDGACDDGLFCNGAEICSPQQDCQPGTPPEVDDRVACTTDRCDEDLDLVVHDPDDGRCDDGAFCNGAEICDPELDCQPGRRPQVNDGVGCTMDSCDEENDVVVNLPLAERCDDGQFCNGAEVCDAELDCQQGSPPNLEDGVGCTVGRCDEVNDRVVQDPNDAACSNGQFCDGAEICDPVNDCQPGVAPVLNDGVGCTRDRCDEDRDEVVHEPDDSVCDDQAVCNGAEFCDPINGCLPGQNPANGTVCAPNPRQICLGGACEASVCGDGFVDAGRGETCEPPEAGCNPATCQRGGGGGDCDYGGYALQPQIAYSCVFGLVNLQYQAFNISENGGRLRVSEFMNGGCQMTGDAPDADGNFTLTCLYAGTCNETYTLTGRFTDCDTFTGTWSVQFRGSCVNCVDQTRQVTGTRN